jgi:TonB family protein
MRLAFGSLLTVLLLILSGGCDSSETPPIPLEYAEVEVKPELVGGFKSLVADAQYPVIAQRARTAGLVTVRVLVNSDGSTKRHEQDLYVKRGIGTGCDEEAVRLASKARFRPGRHQGEAVPVWVLIGVRFALGGDNCRMGSCGDCALAEGCISAEIVEE